MYASAQRRQAEQGTRGDEGRVRGGEAPDHRAPGRQANSVGFPPVRSGGTRPVDAGPARPARPAGGLPRPPRTPAVPTLPHQPPLRGLGGVDAVELLQHVAEVAVGRLAGLPNRWLLFLPGPLRHGVLGAWEEGGRGH